MIVDYSHRGRSASNNATQYHRAVDDFRSLCQHDKMISAAMIIGSYAKKEFIPGWSDLDFIVVIERGYSHCDYRNLFSRVEFIGGNAGIPLGVDYCFLDEINATTGIQGRAFSMALEIANYAEKVKGVIDLPHPPLSKSQLSFLEDERIMITGVELLSWRRMCSQTANGEVKNIYLTAKSLLRLLMYESEPIMSGSVNIQAWLTSVEKVDRLAPYMNAFLQAAEIRTRWAEVISGVWAPSIQDMETALLQYQIK